jgi:predicted phage terminase large subunit-like protein
MMNLRRELENNTLLKNDLGPFMEESGEWGSATLVFFKLNARITVASSEQGIRGVRHNENRPDLIIADDVEDLASTKTRESRNKTYQWLTGEVVPSGEINTRLVIVGNLLHEDSLLMRMKEDVEKNRIDGVFKEYPLIKNGEILWRGKYQSQEAIETEKRKTGNELAWQREYLLRIVPAEDQAIRREWIQYYDQIPDTKIKNKRGHSMYYGLRIGVDLAISKKDSADYTAMVPAYVFESDKFDYQIFIVPRIINRRLNFPETIETCKAIYQSFSSPNTIPQFVIENVAYQSALIQQLHEENIWNIHEFNPGNSDKLTRLALTANMIKTGQILFPTEGCEELLNQIINFGVEKHDDLADAFSSVILSIINRLP